MTQLNTENLKNRQDIIVNHWYDAILPSLDNQSAEIRNKLVEWVDLTITLLTTSPLKRKVARALGENLARDIGPKPAILGKTQDTFVKQFSEGLSIEESAALLPLLGELLSEMAAGFVQEKERQVHSMRRKFLSTTSHDMRSPLNAIIGFSRIILKGIDGPITDLQSQDLSTIYTSGQNLLKMIDQVFNIEKAEAGSIEIDTKTFDLKDLVNNIVSDVQASMDEYDNTLQVNYTASPEKVISDAAKIKQILVNLINHANKFSRKSLVEFNVSLSTTEGATWMRFQISNEGLGMTPAQIERFTQAKDLDTLQYDDIGLMVSQRFCQLLGGELVIESTVDKSTTFTIDLPVRIPNA